MGTWQLRISLNLLVHHLDGENEFAFSYLVQVVEEEVLRLDLDLFVDLNDVVLDSCRRLDLTVYLLLACLRYLIRYHWSGRL